MRRELRIKPRATLLLITVLFGFTLGQSAPARGQRPQVRGRVLERGSDPLEQARVICDEAAEETKTNERGLFTLHLHDEDRGEDRRIHVKKEGYRRAHAMILLPWEGNYTDLNFELEPLCIMGQLVDTASWEPMSGARITVTDTVQPFVADTSDTNGRFRIQSTRFRILRSPPKVKIRVQKEGCGCETDVTIMRECTIYLKCNRVQ